MSLGGILLIKSEYYEKSDLFLYYLYFIVWMCS